MTTVPDTTKPPPSLRIACLLPSATNICVALGLQEFIVGVTHECPRLSSKQTIVLTRDGVNAHASTQAEIHQQVVQTQSPNACSTKKEIPSLYPILADAWQQAKPNLVLTQDLCMVCAPSTFTVRELIDNHSNNNDDNDDDNNDATNDNKEHVKIVSLSPHSISEVADCLVTVAQACGVPERGMALRDEFQSRWQLLQSTISTQTQQQQQQQCAKKKILLLEWLDPPFDGGHWMRDMMTCVGGEPALSSSTSGKNDVQKSKTCTWNDLQESSAEVVVVACCGFDLARNVRDAMQHGPQLQTLPAVQQGRLFAVDAQEYFVQPFAPSLLLGTVLLALAVYADQPHVVEAIRNLPFVPKNWVDQAMARVDLSTTLSLSTTSFSNTTNQTTEKETITPLSVGALAGMEEDDEPAVSDMEDFYSVHQQACEQGQDTYVDPVTGYQVFTRLAHQKRGKCCGSGCRHCPYGHENLKDKTRIQQPSILVHGNEPILSASSSDSPLKVLFHSGGKDSFLTLRSLVRQKQRAKQLADSLFGIVWLTTFDASSRTIAHQEVSIEAVVQQATHLGVTLLGVPLHRASSERYVDRIRLALQTLERTMSQRIETLVFGDLHLEHIVDWRRDQLGKHLGYQLEFPLLKVDYSILKQDLVASQVPCEVSGSTVDPAVRVGELYDTTMIKRLEVGVMNPNDATKMIDVFGECGEFHTLAQVWKVDRAVALGL